MAQLVKQFASGIYNLILGLVTTGKHLGRHAITIQYPKERWTMPERSRGMVVLLTDHETGKLNCTACLLCMRACPSAAINIEVEKDEKGKRHLKEFKVDFNVCCFCGLCQEACNFSAIKLSTKYEFPEYDRNKLVYDKERLAKEGYDVPYEKPVRKAAAAKAPAAPKPDAVPAANTPGDVKAETPTQEPGPAVDPAPEPDTPSSSGMAGASEAKEDIGS